MNKNKYYCKIDGVIHNLSDVQEVLDGKSNRNIVLIMYEDHGMDIVSANTFESVLKFNNNEIPADYDEALKRMQKHNQASILKSPPKPRCPRCRSNRIVRPPIYPIGGELVYKMKDTNPFIKHECQKCGYKW